MTMHGRRVFLGRAAAAGLLVGCGGGVGGQALAQAARSCGRTEPNIEGPFFLPGAPRRTELAPEGTAGAFTVRGRVLTSTCGPARNAVLEVWQADPDGEYDLSGFGYRATVRADAQGRYAFVTVRPGHYLNGSQYRPAHIHVKVHADRMSSLTTQLYFAGDPFNDRDPWIRDSLILRSPPSSCCHPGRNAGMVFDFVL